MKAKYLNHYKDRNPIDTVKVIQDFFNSYGLTVVTTDTYYNYTMYSCIVRLKYNEMELLSANGKGVTQEFAEASGHAELYERFCNGIPLFLPKVMLYDQLRGGIIEPDYTKLIEHNPKEYLLYSKYFNYNPDAVKKFITTTFLRDSELNLYKSLTNDTQKYLSSKFILVTRGTNGMAAGNTLEEALVQGLSEIFERCGKYNFFSNYNDSYTVIDNSAITDDNLLNIINQIEKDNKLYLLDLSYNFNIPCVMGILFDKQSGIVRHCSASAPVFNIAVERILTELYQGIHKELNLNYYQIPFSAIDKNKLQHDAFVSSFIDSYPEEQFTKFKYADSYNANCYLPMKDYSNKELLSFLTDICKNNDIEAYYTDMSLTSEMYAVYIYTPQLNQAISELEFEVNLSKLDKSIEFYELLLSLYSGMIKTKSIDDALLSKICSFNLSEIDIDILEALVIRNEFFTAQSTKSAALEANILIAFINLTQLHPAYTGEKLFKLLEGTPFNNIAKIWMGIYDRLQVGYQKEDLLAFYQNFDPNITMEDICNVTNAKFMIKKIFLEPYLEEVKSGVFDALTAPFIEKNSKKNEQVS